MCAFTAKRLKRIKGDRKEVCQHDVTMRSPSKKKKNVFPLKPVFPPPVASLRRINTLGVIFSSCLGLLQKNGAHRLLCNST